MSTKHRNQLLGFICLGSHVWLILVIYDPKKDRTVLIGGSEHECYIGNVTIPTDELICFKGVGIPPTNVKSP